VSSARKPRGLSPAEVALGDHTITGRSNWRVLSLSGRLLLGAGPESHPRRNNSEHGNQKQRRDGAVIIEAPSMFQARVTAVVRRLAPGLPFGEGLKLSAKMMTAIPPEQIGRMMSGVEAAELIVQLVQGRGIPRP
jgi:hypothetical protein